VEVAVEREVEVRVEVPLDTHEGGEVEQACLAAQPQPAQQEEVAVESQSDLVSGWRYIPNVDQELLGHEQEQLPELQSQQEQQEEDSPSNDEQEAMGSIKRQQQQQGQQQQQHQVVDPQVDHHRSPAIRTEPLIPTTSAMSAVFGSPSSPTLSPPTTDSPKQRNVVAAACYKEAAPLQMPLQMGQRVTAFYRSYDKTGRLSPPSTPHVVATHKSQEKLPPPAARSAVVACQFRRSRVTPNTRKLAYRVAAYTCRPSFGAVARSAY
jgi:hypothetical protein